MRACVSALCLLLLAGCGTVYREPTPAQRTAVASATVTLPATIIHNLVMLEVPGDRGSTCHFIIDTGASVTLVTPDFAQRHADPGAPTPAVPQVRIEAADGSTTQLPTVVLNHIDLDGARFSDVPALVYDCAGLSNQLGVKIDGVLGFPLFGQVLFTLDYPNRRVLIQPLGTAVRPSSGSTVAYHDDNRVPTVPVRLDDRPIEAVLDSGNHEALSLNPAGVAPQFAFGPRQGPTMGTLTGDSIEQIGRLAGTLYIGNYAVPRPVAEINRTFSAIGGGILKYFSVTFDPGLRQVTFYRDATDPIAIPEVRNTGLSFEKTPAYWRVAGIVPGSPADESGVQVGDLVTRIDGELVSQWGIDRYEQLQANAKSIDYSFLDGTQEKVRTIAVGDLVP